MNYVSKEHIIPSREYASRNNTSSQAVNMLKDAMSRSPPELGSRSDVWPRPKPSVFFQT